MHSEYSTKTEFRSTELTWVLKGNKGARVVLAALTLQRNWNASIQSLSATAYMYSPELDQSSTFKLFSLIDKVHTNH